MKGIIFSFKRSSAARAHKKIQLPDVRSVFRRWGITLLFVSLLLVGLALGAVYAQGADSELLQALDFLFTTNLEARLQKGAPGIFCACFASDFIFVTAVYLFGMAPWGLPFELFTVLLKGFGTGLTAAYLLLMNGLSGLGFYLLVLLPGTFLFCVALTAFSAFAFDFSRQQFLFLFEKNPPAVCARERILRYSSRFLSALLMACGASILDTVLWTLFAGTFQ